RADSRRGDSYVEPHHLRHGTDADGVANEAAADENDAAGIGVQLAGVAVVQHHEDAEHEERQRADDVGAGLGFRRQRLDLQLQRLALAQDLAEVLQRLRQIAAGLLLDREADDEEAELGRVDARSDGPQRVRHRLAELDLVGDLAELDADRIADFLADHADRLGGRQTGLEAAHDKVDALGEQGIELVLPAAAHDADGQVRHPEADDDAHQQAGEEGNADEDLDRQAGGGGDG